MHYKFFILVLSVLFIFSNNGYADAPLKGKLDLNTEQARQVQEIQKKYRRSFSAKRQELHRENRKLRRARNDNDSQTIIQQEQITAKLKQELKQIRQTENNEIRGALTPEQLAKFEKVLEQRRARVGSSRDVKDF